MTRRRLSQIMAHPRRQKSNQTTACAEKKRIKKVGEGKAQVWSSRRTGFWRKHASSDGFFKVGTKKQILWCFCVFEFETNKARFFWLLRLFRRVLVDVRRPRKSCNLLPLFSTTNVATKRCFLSALGVATAAKVFVPFGEANMKCCDCW